MTRGVQWVPQPEENPDHVLAIDFCDRLGWGQELQSVARMLGLPPLQRRWRGGRIEAIFSKHALSAWATRVAEFFPSFTLQSRTTPGGTVPAIPTTATHIPLAEVLEILGWDAARLAEAQTQFGFPQTVHRSPNPWTRPEPFLVAHSVSSWCSLVVHLIPGAFPATTGAATTAGSHR